ncbi:Pentatricopeptide repeat-containing protein [Canna indica]|uniref:Pentatricopeptide repeat-containing protein n=1 Tax=Canna indica TaxID=4628 RepID=A0AAQ3KBZ5_9LILI|nr:Pentatricopeptide repeat-containing protein [Canna indica]
MLPGVIPRAQRSVRIDAVLARAQPSPPPTTKAGFAALIRSHAFLPHLKQIHALLLTTGLARKNSLLTRILLSLMSSGNMDYARNLFDDMHKPRIFLWNSLLRGYVSNNLPAPAAGLYRLMNNLAVRPDNFTFPFVLKACAQMLDVWLGAAVHSLLVKSGFILDAIVATELMIMYAKFGDPESAECIFRRISGDADLIAWNAIISALAQNGRADRALKLFDEMESAGVAPDAITLVGVISSCAYLGCLDLGRKLHGHIAQEEVLKTNVFVENALLDMYAKCGSMEEASVLFNEMKKPNVISWSTMIGGYAVNGDSRRALALYARMRSEGFKPNYVTHLAVLSACSHAGLVDEGKKHFNSMVDPRIEHYATMVDLLGRSGHLQEAYDFIRSMPIEPDAGVWGALLGACTIHRNIGLGQIAADEVLRIAPETPSYHVLISNIYAAAGRWDEVEQVRQRMRASNVKKIAAYSSAEVDGKVYIFHERSHSHSKDLQEKLDELTALVMGLGYVPMTRVVLHDVEVEEKEAAVRTHSEKLAIAFGLIRTEPSRAPLRIMKNLRVCSDCHSFAKYVSRAVGREIVMRDKNRFHHFRGGECSCKDFW